MIYFLEHISYNKVVASINGYKCIIVFKDDVWLHVFKKKSFKWNTINELYGVVRVSSLNDSMTCHTNQIIKYPKKYRIHKNKIKPKNKIYFAVNWINRYKKNNFKNLLKINNIDHENIISTYK